MSNDDYSNFINYLNSENVRFEQNAAIKKIHWLKMGDGKASLAIFPKSKEELISVIRFLQGGNTDYLVIGNGSNCYFTDNAVIPVMIVTTKIREVKFESEYIYADAGVALATLAKECSSKGYAGFEGLVGVPGTVGGAARNNSGSYFDCEMSKIVKSVDLLDRNGIVQTIDNEELGYRHRSSRIKRGELDGVIVAVRFNILKAQSHHEIKQRVDVALQRRILELEVRNKNLGAIFVSKEIWPAIKSSRFFRILAYSYIVRVAYSISRRTRKKLKIPTTDLFFLLFLKIEMIGCVSAKAINCFVWKGGRLNDKIFFRYICFMAQVLNVSMEIEVFDKSSKSIDINGIRGILANN